MPGDLPSILTKKTEVFFPVSKLGLYAISIVGRCEGRNDLRLEIDGRFFREIPPKDNIQKYDVPPAWNGSKLHNLKQTNIFLLKLDPGQHTITFFPEGQAKVEEWSYWQVEDATKVVFDLNENAEDGNKRPWLNFILVDLPLISVTAEVSASWRLLDGDDVKLIIDNEIEYNPNSLLWRNWVWHATPGQILSGVKKEQKVLTKNLESGMHYVEFWADKTPTLHQVVLNLGELTLESGSQPAESSNGPTVGNPKWTENFSDDSDQIILARALFGEARSTLVPDEARVAIAWVIKNRVESNRWPNTYWEVITTPSQFSSFSQSDPNRAYVENPLHKDLVVDKKAWEHAYEIAGKVINNKLSDPTNGANHFYDDSISVPPWAKDQKPTLTVSYINKFEQKASIFFFKL